MNTRDENADFSTRAAQLQSGHSVEAPVITQWQSRQVTITDVLGTRTNVYDVATLALVEEQLPDGTVLARTQDNLGRPSGISLDSDYTVATDMTPRAASFLCLLRILR